MAKFACCKGIDKRNLDGKIVCPFSACGKQYVSDAQFGKHLMRDHYKELSMKDTEKIRDITSVSSQESKSPSVPISSLKTGSGGVKKKTHTISPVQTRSKSKKLSKTDADAVKKNYFFRENTQSHKSKIY